MLDTIGNKLIENGEENGSRHSLVIVVISLVLGNVQDKK